MNGEYSHHESGAAERAVAGDEADDQSDSHVVELGDSEWGDHDTVAGIDNDDWRDQAATHFDHYVEKSDGSEEKSADPARVHAAATAGTRGPGGSLPYLDSIQKSFGKFDISKIEAHTDGAAAESALSMGAEGFSFGNHVAFAGAPSLHTAAHEAAHFLQRSGSVQLKGGVGEADDVYEQQADAVADRVVRGESAEALLEGFAGSAASVCSPAVQLKPGDTVNGEVKVRGSDSKLAILTNAIRPWFELPDGAAVSAGDKVTFKEGADRAVTELVVTGKGTASADEDDKKVALPADLSASINVGSMTLQAAGGRVAEHNAWGDTESYIRAHSGAPKYMKQAGQRGFGVYQIVYDKTSWKNGHILFEYDDKTTTAYVFHSGPGG